MEDSLVKRERPQRQLPAYKPTPWKQTDCWKAMMNIWLFQMMRERRGIGDIQRALLERDRLAVQCREMWGSYVPEDRAPIVDVLAGMMRQLEGTL